MEERLSNREPSSGHTRHGLGGSLVEEIGCAMRLGWRFEARS